MLNKKPPLPKLLLLLVIGLLLPSFWWLAPVRGESIEAVPSLSSEDHVLQPIPPESLDETHDSVTRVTYDTYENMDMIESRTSTLVSSVSEFNAAYLDPTVFEIVLQSDISAPTLGNLSRDLVIDGNGYTLTTANDIRLTTTSVTKTLTLKNMSILTTTNLNFINVANYDYSKNWDIVLENISVPKLNMQRIIRAPYAHLHIYGEYTVYTRAENMYIGQITVHSDAKVYGEIFNYNYSTWWFERSDSQGSLDIEPGAYVELNGISGSTYPAIYEHFREVNIGENATLKVNKPGNAFRFNNTTGVTDKYLRIAKGATFFASTSGSNTTILNADGQNGHIIAEEGSYFYVRGTTSGNTTPLINLSYGTSSLTLNKPAKYDLRNNNNNGRTISVGAQSKFIIQNSDIEVWKQGTNLDGASTNSWFQTSLVANSSGAAESSTDPELLSIWNTLSYARISGINVNPVLAFQEITDADTNFEVIATVDGIPAWEGQVDVEVTNDEDSEVFTGKSDASGKFKFSRSTFYQAGTTLTATGTRGPYPTLDPQATTVVTDVTPPNPTSIDPISDRMLVISGVADEPGAKVSASVDHVPLLDKEGNPLTATVATDGSWHINIPNYLHKDQMLQIFLTDSKGNKNPTIDTPYHDAIFKGATTIIVSEDLGTLRFAHIPEELPFGKVMIPTKKTVIERSDPNWKIDIEDSRVESLRNSWKVNASLTSPLSTLEGEMLPNALVFIQGNDTKILNESEILIYESPVVPDLTTEVTWDKNQGILLEVDPDPIRAKSYQATIKWTLQDAP